VREAAWVRTALASAFVCAAGGALFWYGTSGFRGFTSEGARRADVARVPRSLPEVILEDEQGRVLSFARYRGRPVVVNFVYTRCTTICPLLSAGFQRLSRADATEPPLLSISFDPSDSPERLREYASHYRRDASDWRFARVRGGDTASLGALLRAFGIVVIPDGRGDFQHNAAIHVISADGRLARVLDAGSSPDDVARAVAEIIARPRLASAR
jgi:protein SCO1